MNYHETFSGSNTEQIFNPHFRTVYRNKKQAYDNSKIHQFIRLGARFDRVFYLYYGMLLPGGGVFDRE